MAEIIDAHHHLWRYTPEEYGWIGPEMSVLQRDYLADDLVAATVAAGVSGTVAVQARQSLQETSWLLQLAEANPVIRGVVGWAPLASAQVSEVLRELSARPKLKGLRHVVQDEPQGFLLGEDFNAGVALLADAGLVYDILIHARQLPEAVAFVKQHPWQAFVLDHCAKPAIRAGEFEPWREGISRLAEHANVCCKLSGLVTEADWTGWSPEQLEPYLDAVLDAFGAERLMAGSDWPVCLVASSYTRWWSTLRAWTARLRPDEQAQVLGGTAKRVYRL